MAAPSLYEFSLIAGIAAGDDCDPAGQVSGCASARKLVSRSRILLEIVSPFGRQFEGHSFLRLAILHPLSFKRSHLNFDPLGRDSSPGRVNKRASYPQCPNLFLAR